MNGSIPFQQLISNHKKNNNFCTTNFIEEEIIVMENAACKVLSVDERHPNFSIRTNYQNLQDDNELGVGLTLVNRINGPWYNPNQKFN